MKIIKCLAEKIEEELHDASEYADLAIKWKAESPEAADLFYELSTEEMGHVNKLHQAVTNMIEKYRVQHGDPPKDMMTLYEYLHEKHVAAATQVKVMQAMFKMQE